MIEWIENSDQPKIGGTGKPFPPIFLPEPFKIIAMKNRYLIAGILMLASNFIFAQTAGDVLRYSYLQPGGTARFLGAGGAFGALGAEFGGLSENPAGIGMFRSNELVFTPALHFSNTTAHIPGNVSSSDNKSTFAFDNFGLVFNTTPGGKHWKAVNFAIGLNRQNTYSSSIFYEGTANGTITTGWYNDALNTINNGGTSDDFYPYDTKLAYDAGAIFQDQNTGAWTYDFLGNENASLYRSQAINTFGKMNEMALSFGGNYDEKLMIGATLGIPFVNYRLEGEYIEQDKADVVDFFDKLTYTEYLRTEGVGVNLKLGVIYKINQIFRVGAAFHTPTAFSLTDTYSNTLAYEYTVNGTHYGGDPISPDQDGISDYKLRTPWRATGSLSAIIRKIGFLSADVEVVDYSNNRYNFTANVASQENQAAERAVNNEIQRAYKQAVNVRLGGELALNNFRLRGGFDMLGKPEQGQEGFNTAITAGAGVRGESFYLDLGWRHYNGKGSVTPYSSAPVATTSNVTNDILLTVGFKF